MAHVPLFENLDLAQVMGVMLFYAITAYVGVKLRSMLIMSVWGISMILSILALSLNLNPGIAVLSLVLVVVSIVVTSIAVAAWGDAA